jgi:hypothetical protein
MFGAAAGSSPLVGLNLSPDMLAGGGRSAAAGVQTGRGGSPSLPTGRGGDAQTMTRAELRAVAQRLGISEAVAEQQAKARGIAVQ